jgi:hypothetical protein
MNGTDKQGMGPMGLMGPMVIFRPEEARTEGEFVAIADSKCRSTTAKAGGLSFVMCFSVLAREQGEVA